MRQSSSHSDKRRRLREFQAPRSNNDAKSRQEEGDRDHPELNGKHAYVQSWIQTLRSQPSFDNGSLEADQVIEDVERWKSHNLPLSKRRSNYGNKLDQNRSSWVLRDHPLQSPPRPHGNDNGSSGGSAASLPSSFGKDHQKAETVKEDAYRKRPRAKTRLDHYDTKKRTSHAPRDEQRPTKKRKSGTKRRIPPEEKSPRMRSSRSQALRSRKDIMHRFTSSAIPSTTTRVTLKPNFTAGLFMNGRGPLSGTNTDPVDSEAPIDKSSAPIIPSGNLETSAPENDQGEKEKLEHKYSKTSNRRRNHFDEAEDFFAHGHLDHERSMNVNDAMAAQTKKASPTCAVSKSHNMQESSPKGDIEGRALEGKTCPQPDNSEMRDNLESNTGLDPASRNEALVNSPESDRSSIPTPILRKLFKTGVFSYQNSFAKDQRETRAPECEEIIPGSYSDGLDNSRVLNTNQFPAHDKQPCTEGSKHSVEPEYSVPGLHEKLHEWDSVIPNYFPNQMTDPTEGMKSNAPSQAQFSRMDYYLKPWMTSSDNTTPPTHHHVFEADYFAREKGQRWADQSSSPSKLPLPSYTGISGRPWSSKGFHGREYFNTPIIEQARPRTALLVPGSVPVEDSAFQPFIRSSMLEKPTPSIPLTRAEPMMDGARFNMEFGGASSHFIGEPMDRRVELEHLENELLPSRGINHEIAEEHAYRINDYSPSTFLNPGFDQLPRFMDRATSRLSGRKEDLSSRRGTETTEGTIDLDLAQFWRPNPFL